MSTDINKKRYIFIMNSTKPSEYEYTSLDDIKINNFSRPCLIAAHELGYEVILGVNRKYAKQLKCKEMPYLKFYNSHTYRDIFAFKDNYRAYRNLCNELKKGNVDVIHCNTPIGGVVGRLGGHKYKIRKIIYTAHGFHFFKGAPIFNNIVIKFIEKILAHWTDAIITMNEEDYCAAKKMRLKKNGNVHKVHGVGINLKEFNGIVTDIASKRSELNLKLNDIICISAGDLVARKNYDVAIKAIAKSKNENIHYLICGLGSEKNNLEMLTKISAIENRVHFLGYRTDIKELMSISDIFLFTSLQEGLPRSMMEAMACGLPCIASKIRGNIDLLDDNAGGFLCNPKDTDEISEKLRILVNNPILRKKMSAYNLKRIKEYDIDNVNIEIKSIYTETLKY